MRFKISSTEITVSYLLICLAAICVIAGAFENFICCLISVIIHESGHITAMCIFGFAPDRIKISLFEISINDKSRHKRTFWQNLIIIFSGPFYNFICFIVFYLLYLIGNEIFYVIAMANLSVGLFNMLPVLSLDGGQLLYAILTRFFSDVFSEKIVNIITFIFLFPLFALGFLLLFKSKYNFSLLIVCVYLVFSLVCKDSKYY